MDDTNGEDSEIHARKQNNNKAIVNTLYKALASGDTSRVVELVDSDLEWWFHGPQNCHHMMKMLTGESSREAFKFEPRSIDAIKDDDSVIVVEGWEGSQAYWIHVWILKDGLIIQFREYFNTWLTVTDLGPPGCSNLIVWQSHPRDLAKRALPGLLLAI